MIDRTAENEILKRTKIQQKNDEIETVRREIEAKIEQNKDEIRMIRREI